MGWFDVVRKIIPVDEAESFLKGVGEDVERHYKKVGEESERTPLKLAEEQLRIQDDINKFTGVDKSAVLIPAAQAALKIGWPFQSAEPTQLDSRAWASKYLEVQRQVAEARAVTPPPKPIEELTIEKIALPAAGIGIAFWLLT